MTTVAVRCRVQVLGRWRIRAANVLYHLGLPGAGIDVLRGMRVRITDRAGTRLWMIDIEKHEDNDGYTLGLGRRLA